MTPERWQQVKEAFSRASALSGAERKAYVDSVCAQDPPLGAELRSLLAADACAEAILDRAASDYLPDDALADPADTLAGHRVGAYELLERLGRGGMSDVYRARRADAQFDKEVAVKLMHAGPGSELLLQRFRAERQILASLEHPNIARLLDAGVSAQGEPYIVMELVDGEPIDAWCEKRQPPIAQRLRLFREICSAVSYAHRRLIVHRDLKPANILVTPTGHVKLLDFGIAKLLQADAGGDAAPEATRTILRAMTPAFSSPEQILGAPITTASDVYSLGVVLYHLLAGHGPYRSSLRTTKEAIEDVCEKEPLRPGIDRELDDIILVALRKEPDRRYGSVDQLSADIERYVEGRPVLAHGDELSYLAGKFIRRHRLGLIAASLVAISLLGGLIAATHEARVAEREKARAEHNFARVRALADSLLFELHDAIQDLPGATAARRLLAGRALSYLDELHRDAAGDIGLERDLAAGYERVGDVLGKPFSASLGDTAGATKSYRAALDLREQVHAASDRLEDSVALARSRRLYAGVLAMGGKIRTAREQIGLAIALSEPLSRSQPRNAAVLEELVRDYADLAGVLGGNFNSANLGDQDAAMSAHARQLAAARQLVALAPGNADYRMLEIMAMLNSGDQLLSAGRMREAAQFYQAVLPELEAQAHSSESARALQWLHSLYTRIIALHFWERNPAAAVPIARAAFALTQHLAADSHDAYARLDLATDYANLADALSQSGTEREASAAAAQATGILRALQAADPSNSEYRVTYGLALYIAGEVADRGKDRGKALQFLRDSLAVFEAVQRTDADNVDARLHVAAVLVRIGDLEAGSRNAAGAQAAYSRAVALSSPEGAAPNSPEARFVAASAFEGLGRLATAAMGRKPVIGNDARRTTACRWFARAADARVGIQEIGATSPNGFYISPGHETGAAPDCTSALMRAHIGSVH